MSRICKTRAQDKAGESMIGHKLAIDDSQLRRRKDDSRIEKDPQALEVIYASKYRSRRGSSGCQPESEAVSPQMSTLPIDLFEARESGVRCMSSE